MLCGQIKISGQRGQRMKLLISLITLFLISASFPQEIKEKENSLLTYAQTKMSINNYVDMMRALEIGERYFNTEKDIVLAVIFIESDFNVWASDKQMIMVFHNRMENIFLIDTSLLK